MPRAARSLGGGAGVVVERDAPVAMDGVSGLVRQIAVALRAEADGP
jgi:hypothetical protein